MTGNDSAAMELGLVCALCSQLNPLRATVCQRCAQGLIAVSPAPAHVPSGVATGPSTPLSTPAPTSTPVPSSPPVEAVAAKPIFSAQVPVSPTAATAVPGMHFAPPAASQRAAVAPVPPISRTSTPSPVFATPPSGFTPAPPAYVPISSAVPTQPIPTPLSTSALSSPPAGIEAAPNPASALPNLTPPNLTPPTLNPGLAAPVAEGSPVRTLFFGALQQQTQHPRLVVIKGGNADGVTYTLANPSQELGRKSGEIAFPNDVFLGSPHANFAVQNGKVIVADLGSANGVFLRIRQPVALGHGDMFLVGEQLLQLDLSPFPEYAPDANGTYYYGSPRTDTCFRVLQLLAGGGEGSMEVATGAGMTIGREGNNFDFPRDRFISGQHARLDFDARNNQAVLRDLGSRNGTFVRLTGPTELAHGDYLFLGQQLLRVELS